MAQNLIITFVVPYTKVVLTIKIRQMESIIHENERTDAEYRL
jgi:hypothetical protein